MEETEQQERILVVDDSEFSRKQVITALEEAGLNVVGEAASANEAAEVFNSSDPNILLIDVVMPDVNGIKLAEGILEIDNNVYIIMMSALSQEQVIIEAISAGAIDFLQKPFSKQLLVQSVQKAIKQMKNDKNY